MKGRIFIIIAVMTLLIAIGVNAEVTGIESGGSVMLAGESSPVFVVGKVTHDGTPVPGAQVSISCGIEPEAVVSTDSNGRYAKDYTGSDGCKEGSPVSVSAYVESTGADGSNTGEILDYYDVVEIAIVDVHVPEFGTIAAGVALFGAGAAYVLRRKR